MKLHYRTYGNADNPAIVILHGLFGLGDNWVRIARKLADNYYVVVPDHRNHGLSPQSDRFSIPLMVEDALALMRELNIEKPVIIGHSMGGKVAMHWVLEHPNTVSGLIVADISTKPSYVRPEHKAIIDQFQQLDLTSFSSLQDIQAHLIQHMSSPKLAFMVMKNIKRVDNAFAWKLHVEGIYKNIDEVLAGIESEESYMNAVFILRGGASDYVLDEDVAELQHYFPFAELRTIEGASHWLHADNPDAFYTYIKEYLNLIRY